MSSLRHSIFSAVGTRSWEMGGCWSREVRWSFLRKLGEFMHTYTLKDTVIVHFTAHRVEPSRMWQIWVRSQVMGERVAVVGIQLFAPWREVMYSPFKAIQK